MNPPPARATLGGQALDDGLGDRRQRALGHTGGGRQGEQGEGLLVEIGRRADRLAHRVDGGAEQPVGPAIATDEEVEAVRHGLAPGSRPAQFAADRIGEDLARLDAGPTVAQHGMAGEIDSLVEAPARPIRADRPPQRQGIVQQPVQQPVAVTGKFGFDIARGSHAYP